ncbi:MAG: ATP-binding protein [Flavobacteriales bacterium]|nr:MAG: ATP-binding protein [Flavobacteriales bacterium]
MNSPASAIRELLAILAFLITASACAQSGWPAYERFRAVMGQNEPAALGSLGKQLTGSADPRERHLGLLAWAASLHRSDDLVAGISAFDSVLATVPATEYGIRATARQMLSNAFTMLGDPEKGLMVAEEGLRDLPGNGHARERIGLHIVRAEAKLVKGDDLAEVFDAFVVAARLAGSAGFHLGHAQAENGMGLVRLNQAGYDEAWSHFSEALRHGRLAESARSMQNTVANLSITATMSGHYDKALHLCDSLLQAGSLSPEFEANLYTERGVIHKRQGLLDAAIRDFERARALLDPLPSTRTKVKLPHHMASLYWTLGRRDEAFSSLHAALAEAERMNWKDLQAEIHRGLHNYHHELGQLAPALKHIQAYAILSDSVNAVRYDEQIARSAALYDTEKKEHRIKEQEQAIALAAAEDRRKAMQRNALIGTTGALLLVALLLYRAMRHRQRLAAKQKELHDQQVDQLLSQQEIKSINAMLEGQEKERERMAKDLHDRLGSMLGGIKANLSALEDRVESMRQDQQYQKVTRLMEHAVGELRQISHDMAAATLSRFGLEKALKDLRDTLHINGRLQVELNTFGLDQRLERGVEIAVYRIVQESVSNVLKHAKATELSIGVTRAPGRLSVVVSDNGVGFDTAHAGSGMGLGNVRSRAAAIGATVQIDSTPGKGTTVSVECPVVE